VNELSILLLPLGAGALVLLTHVPLGEQVLRRGIVFIDLAIAQVAALGVLMASSMIDDATLALIGLVYVAGAVLALLWVSADPRGGQKLSAMLSGDVLWVDAMRLAPLAAATLPFLLLHLFKPQLWADGRLFYPCFAILVSLSVPLLGLYLVFATLIVPALAFGGGTRAAAAKAVGLGGCAYAAGLLASLWWDLPSGPCIVLALMLCGGAVAAVRGRSVAARDG
jgi:zinc/manganese transport system permease protein